jgi:hypothetical protein
MQYRKYQATRVKKNTRQCNQRSDTSNIWITEHRINDSSTNLVKLCSSVEKHPLQEQILSSHKLLFRFCLIYFSHSPTMNYLSPTTLPGYCNLPSDQVTSEG